MVYPMTIVYYSSYILYDCVNETSLNSFAIFLQRKPPISICFMCERP